MLTRSSAVLATLAALACGEAPAQALSTVAPPFAPMQPLPAAANATVEGAADGATPAASSEVVAGGIDRVSTDPDEAAAGAPEDDADAGVPPQSNGGEPVSSLGEPIASIASPGFPSGSPPRLVPQEFVGPITGRAVLFNVYLPPGYDSGAASYPVLYDLHGLTDTRDTNPGPVIRSFEAGMRGGLVGPLIVVFPQSFAEGYYADSRDGARPGETQIIDELIPYVDSSFRTLAHRARRGVSGFSMGGFGALAYAMKYPERFSVGIGYDSALDTWQTLLSRRAYIAAAAFGNDESSFDQISPWASAARNAAVLTASSRLRLVPGTQYRDFNEAFGGHLTTLGIAHDFVQTDCPHDYGCVIEREGARSWALIQSKFSEPAAADAP